jgi:phenylacetate-CoA ligase
VIWQPEAECLPRETLQALQLERLRATIQRVLTNVPVFADRLRGAGVRSPSDIRSLADLQRLPFATKSDLRDHYPFGLLAAPVDRLTRIHASSGTRGKPTVVGYTRHDLDVWSDVVARCLAMAGVLPGMLIHNAYGYGLFTGGLGLHQGAERLGCSVLPISGGLTERQATLLRDLGGQVLCCTPSYAISIAEALDAAHIEASSLRLAIGVFGAEPWTEELRATIEQRLHIVALNIYGLSEITGPGVSAECVEGRNGSHVNEDHFYPEIIEPVNGRPLGPGEEGELVFTTLSKEAMPLIRYRTGDISALASEPCPCGRTTSRMARIKGRYDDMLIIRGVNLYPSEVERVLLSVGEVAPHYQLVVTRPSTLDELLVRCEPASETVDRAALREHVERALHRETGLTFRVEVTGRNELPRSEGKALRVLDHRVARR